MDPTDFTVSILVPGAEDDGVNVKDVTLQPGTRVRDVLKSVGLEGYLLRTKDGTFLSADDDLTKAVPAGGKLYALPEVKVAAAATLA